MEESQRFGAQALPQILQGCSVEGPGGTSLLSPPGMSEGMSWSEREGFGSRPSNSFSDPLFTATVLGRAVCSPCFPSSCSAGPHHHHCALCQHRSPETAPCLRSSELLLSNSSLLPEPAPGGMGLLTVRPPCILGCPSKPSCRLLGTCQACAWWGLS